MFFSKKEVNFKTCPSFAFTWACTCLATNHLSDFNFSSSVANTTVSSIRSRQCRLPNHLFGPVQAIASMVVSIKQLNNGQLAQPPCFTQEVAVKELLPITPVERLVAASRALRNRLQQPLAYRCCRSLRRSTLS